MKNKAAQALGSIKSAAKTQAARENGKLGGRPGRYYALHWSCGYGATHANTGEDFATVYGFGSKAERDEACANFSAPNHCPQAALEAVPASNANVRKAIRGSECGGSRMSNVMEWDA